MAHSVLSCKGSGCIVDRHRPIRMVLTDPHLHRKLVFCGFMAIHQCVPPGKCHTQHRDPTAQQLLLVQCHASCLSGLVPCLIMVNPPPASSVCLVTCLLPVRHYPQTWACLMFNTPPVSSSLSGDMPLACQTWSPVSSWLTLPLPALVRLVTCLLPVRHYPQTWACLMLNPRVNPPHASSSLSGDMPLQALVCQASSPDLGLSHGYPFPC